MGDAAVATGTIRTRIPARLDRLPWSRFHWMVVIGLGTVWILDGLEVTLVGSIAGRLTEKGSGIHLSAGDIGTAAAVYVVGACTGALFFGQLTDRFGRKRLFMITLATYILATTATAFSFSAWYFFLARFLTGAGIGGEYSSINSAIDELIPARVRGRVDLMINGSYWLGSAAGSAAALIFLNEAILAKDVGWRVAFGMGAVLGLAILVVRRNVPESPRWLFIHGREQEAERIVEEIERRTVQDTGQRLSEPKRELKVRQRETVPFREIARTAFGRYPRRAVLGFTLFVGQAFLYNGITFNLGTLFTTFYKVSSSFVPVFIIVFAVGNMAGPLLLGRLFDTVGRKPMIVATYLGSAIFGLVLAYLFWQRSLGTWGLEAFIVATFFLASAGASAAYLTVSEIFPMETRALAIAFFYAIGTGAGGIAGPLLFGHFIESGSFGKVAIAFAIGSSVMALGALAELLFGVRAEGRSLEEIARPITSEEADRGDGAIGSSAGESEAEQPPSSSQTRRRALEPRQGEHVEDAARANERPQHEREPETRLRERLERTQGREREGMRRFRPGPGSGHSFYSPGMIGSASGNDRREQHVEDLEREVDAIAQALEEAGPLTRAELARRVGARYWGPGRFRAAQREALESGRARAISRNSFAAPGRDGPRAADHREREATGKGPR